MRQRPLSISLPAFLALILCPMAEAIGPENVLVLVNANNSEGLAVANHYRVVRKIPERNMVFLDYTGDPWVATVDQFQKMILEPAKAHLKKKQLEGQIAVWVTTRGLPNLIDKNSISGMIHFGGHQPTIQSEKLGPAGFEASNGYFSAMQAFQPPPPGLGRFYLHMRLDAGTYEESVALIDRSVKADFTNPKGIVYLCDGVGPRDSRKNSIDAALRFLEMLKVPVDHVKNNWFVQDKSGVLGIYTGVWDFPFRNINFIDGALADHLTSLGAVFHHPHDQMLCDAWLRHGCSATYGTVIEPFNYPAKFPTAFLYVYYSLGLSAVESYWMSVQWPQQGLFIGDPLTRPYANPPSIKITNLADAQIVSGLFQLELDVNVAEDGPGIRKIDVYLDDYPAGTMEAPPLPAGTILKATMGDKSCEYKSLEKESLAHTVERFAASIANLSSTIKIISANPSNVVFIDSDPLSKLSRMKLESSAPDLVVDSIATRSGLVTPQITDSVWHFNGNSLKGDALELKIREKGAERAVLNFVVERDAPAANIGLLMASGVRADVPAGIKIVGVPVTVGNPLGGIRLILDKEAQDKEISVVLSLKASPGSSLNVTNNGEEIRLQQPAGAGAAHMALLRITYGQRRVKRKIALPTDSMPDGMHSIRVVAQEGSTAASSTSLIRSFVIQNGPQKLVLEPISKKVVLRANTADIAKGRLATPEAGATIEYRIDGRPAGDADSEGVLKIETARWGLGTHRVMARTEIAGKDLYSENVVEFEIVP